MICTTKIYIAVTHTVVAELLATSDSRVNKIKHPALYDHMVLLSYILLQN